MCGLGRTMPGDQVVAQRGSQATGGERRDAGREAVEQDQTALRPAAASIAPTRPPSSNSPSAARQPSGSAGVGGIGGERRRDNRAFALPTPLRVEACSTAADVLRGRGRSAPASRAAATVVLPIPISPSTSSSVSRRRARVRAGDRPQPPRWSCELGQRRPSGQSRRRRRRPPGDDQGRTPGGCGPRRPRSATTTAAPRARASTPIALPPRAAAPAT